MDVYIFQADIYCDECGRDIQSGLERAVPPEERDDSDRYPQGPHGDGGGEADCPQHCGACRTFLRNPLTDDGDKYVREKAAPFMASSDDSWDEIARRAEEEGAPIVAEWVRYYLQWAF